MGENISNQIPLAEEITLHATDLTAKRIKNPTPVQVLEQLAAAASFLMISVMTDPTDDIAAKKIIQHFASIMTDNHIHTKDVFLKMADEADEDASETIH